MFSLCSVYGPPHSVGIDARLAAFVTPVKQLVFVTPAAVKSVQSVGTFEVIAEQFLKQDVKIALRVDASIAISPSLEQNQFLLSHFFSVA